MVTHGDWTNKNWWFDQQKLTGSNQQKGAKKMRDDCKKRMKRGFPQKDRETSSPNMDRQMMGSRWHGFTTKSTKAILGWDQRNDPHLALVEVSPKNWATCGNRHPTPLFWGGGSLICYKSSLSGVQNHHSINYSGLLLGIPNSWMMIIPKIVGM